MKSLIFDNYSVYTCTFANLISQYYYTIYEYIREYGSTLYVGMVLVVSFSPYIGIGAKFRIRLKIAETRLCRVKYRTAML